MALSWMEPVPIKSCISKEILRSIYYSKQNFWYSAKPNKSRKHPNTKLHLRCENKQITPTGREREREQSNAKAV